MFHKLSLVKNGTIPERIRKATEGLHPSVYANRLPVGLRELSVDEFAKSKFFTYTPDFTRFNQCPEKSGGPTVNWHEYWYNDGTGYAMVADYWAGKLRYFTMGCEHKYEEVSSPEVLGNLYPEHAGKFERGRCMHNTVCTKCRVLWIYDSSD